MQTSILRPKGLQFWKKMAIRVTLKKIQITAHWKGSRGKI